MKKTTIQPTKAVKGKPKGTAASAPTRRSKGAAQGRTSASATSSTPATRSPTVPSLGAQEQVALFDRAVSLFRKGSLEEARALFEKAAAGPVREVAHSARTHRQVCERRLGQSDCPPSTAEDHYNIAVAFINRRELGKAEQHLRTAAGLSPDADHIHYALALTLGLRGEIQQAVASLRRAVEINPHNRSQARRDPDFAGLIHQPALAAVLRGDKEQGD